MSSVKYLVLAGLLFGLSGCESTISDSGAVRVKAGGTAGSSSLETLALDTGNIQKLLMLAPWTKIETDIRAFYENDNYPSARAGYTIIMTFDRRKVTAYADCQRVTANYRINGKEITFRDVAIAPAIELATCIESEYADDAVIALFENSFEVKKMTEKEAVLEAIDFDTEVVLKR